MNADGIERDGSSRRRSTASATPYHRVSASRSGTATASSSRSRTAATSTSTPSRRTARPSRSCSSAASSRIGGYDARDGELVYVVVDAHDDARAVHRRRTDARSPTSAARSPRAASSSRRSASPPSRRTATEVDAWIVAPGRLRGGHALPVAAQHPRRAVHAVRHRLLRRVPGVRRRRLRRALLEPARRLRLLGGVGPRDPRARSTTPAPAGAPSTTRT